MAFAEALPKSSLTSLKCAAALCARFLCSGPLTCCPSDVPSIDGHPLPLDELKGTKPTESIDLSGKRIGVASGIIIAACIKDNPVLKQLK